LSYGFEDGLDSFLGGGKSDKKSRTTGSGEGTKEGETEGTVGQSVQPDNNTSDLPSTTSIGEGTEESRTSQEGDGSSDGKSEEVNQADISNGDDAGHIGQDNEGEGGFGETEKSNKTKPNPKQIETLSAEDLHGWKYFQARMDGLISSRPEEEILTKEQQEFLYEFLAPKKTQKSKEIDPSKFHGGSYLILKNRQLRKKAK
jgi:hypothetical protein